MMFSGRRILNDDLLDFYNRTGWEPVFEHSRGSIFIEVWQPTKANGSQDPEHTHVHFFRVRNSVKEPGKVERVYVMRASDIKEFNKCHEVFQKWYQGWCAPKVDERFWAAQRRKCSVRRSFDH